MNVVSWLPAGSLQGELTCIWALLRSVAVPQEEAGTWLSPVYLFPAIWAQECLLQAREYLQPLCQLSAGEKLSEPLRTLWVSICSNALLCLVSVSFKCHQHFSTVHQELPGLVKQWKGLHSLPCSGWASPYPDFAEIKFAAALRLRLFSEESFPASSPLHSMACLQNLICPFSKYLGVLHC